MKKGSCCTIARDIQVDHEHNIRLSGGSSCWRFEGRCDLGICEQLAERFMDLVGSTAPDFCSRTPGGETVMFRGNATVSGVSTEGWKPSGVCATAAAVEASDTRMIGNNMMLECLVY